MLSRVISTLKGTLLGIMILITLYNNYLLSPPTLQEGGGVGGVGGRLYTSNKDLTRGISGNIVPYPKTPKL